MLKIVYACVNQGHRNTQRKGQIFVSSIMLMPHIICFGSFYIYKELFIRNVLFAHCNIVFLHKVIVCIAEALQSHKMCWE